MHSTIPRIALRMLVATGLVLAALTLLPATNWARQSPVTSPDPACSPEERRQALRKMQSDVLSVAPTQIPSFADALAKDGALEGYRLSHGYVALAGAGAVAVDNLEAKPPLPPLLLYEPSPDSHPREWLDFDGPDDPYRLAGWAYIAPYEDGSTPPRIPCIAADDWYVHEAGWHLKDGGMYLTPGAEIEPPRPPDLAIHMWHPRIWDLHVWRGDDGVAVVTFANPKERKGGKALPEGSFFKRVGPWVPGSVGP